MRFVIELCELWSIAVELLIVMLCECLHIQSRIVFKYFVKMMKKLMTCQSCLLSFIVQSRRRRRRRGTRGNTKSNPFHEQRTVFLRLDRSLNTQAHTQRRIRRWFHWPDRLLRSWRRYYQPRLTLYLFTNDSGSLMRKTEHTDYWVRAANERKCSYVK